MDTKYKLLSASVIFATGCYFEYKSGLKIFTKPDGSQLQEYRPESPGFGLLTSMLLSLCVIYL